MTTSTLKRFAAGALMSLSVAMAGVGLTAGTPKLSRAVRYRWEVGPGVRRTTPPAHARWCPGDPPVQTGNIRVYPVVWDNNVCHTYWYVYSGQGNVAHNIFEGDTPPPPPPPPPNLTPPLPPGWCWALFIPTTSCPNG